MKRIGMVLLGALLLAGTAAAQQTVEFWCWAEHCKVANALKPDFEEQNPGQTLDIVEMGPWDLHDRLLISMAVGSGGPDAAVLVQRRFQQYADSGQLLDIMGDFGDLEGTYPPFLWDLASENDALYGLPYDQAPGVLFYRSDLMSDAGVDMPIETWEEFYRIGTELTNDGNYMTWQFVPGGGWGVAFYVMFLQSRGGNLFEADGQVIQNNDEAAATLCWYKDLGEISLQTENNSPDFFAALKADNLYTYATPPWGMSGIKQLAPELSGDWSVQPWPAWEGYEAGTTGAWGGSILTIPEQTDNPEGAKALLELIAANVQGGSAMWQVGNLLPAYEPSLAYEGVHQPDPYLGGAVMYDEAIAPRYLPTFRFFNWAEAETLIGNEIDRMFADDLDCNTVWNDIENILTTTFN